ncbi:MAG: hypothetical protein ACE5QF_09995 [Thermoplasmata archaeon]
MTEDDVGDEFAICPLCYCPFYPSIEDCPECDRSPTGEDALAETENVNPIQNHGLFARWWNSISRLPKTLIRSNER